MNCIVFMVMVLASTVWAGPTSQPTTKPDSAPLQAAVEKAKLAETAAERKCIVSINTDEYRDAKALLAAAERDLKEARSSGTAADRIRTSSAFNVQRRKVKELEDDAMAKDPAVAQARSELGQKEIDLMRAVSAESKRRADARETERASEAANEREREASDPVYAGLKHGKLVVGMSKEQVLKVFKMNEATYGNHEIMYNPSSETELIEGKSVTTETWKSLYYYPLFFSTLTFENGKLVRIVAG